MNTRTTEHRLPPGAVNLRARIALWTIAIISFFVTLLIHESDHAENRVIMMLVLCVAGAISLNSRRLTAEALREMESKIRDADHARDAAMDLVAKITVAARTPSANPPDRPRPVNTGHWPTYEQACRNLGVDDPDVRWPSATYFDVVRRRKEPLAATHLAQVVPIPTPQPDLRKAS